MSHRERLTAPFGWWIGATGFALVCSWLLYVATTPAIGLITFAVAAGVAFAVVWVSGDLVVAVDDELRAGRAHVAGQFLGEVEALDHARYRELFGPQADVRAWIATRPWVHTGVRVWIDDPSDPHPYWLLGSRHPERLAAAIDDLRQTGRRTAPGDAPPKGV